MNIHTYISKLFKTIGKDSLIVTSTGKISREAWGIYSKNAYKFGLFPMVGSMGGAVPIALGIAINTDKQVICITGDGSLLMKLGALATVKRYSPKNLRIIVLDNGCHGSTGGQKTNFDMVRDFVEESCEIIKVDNNYSSDLGRPEDLLKVRDEFIKHV